MMLNRVYALQLVCIYMNGLCMICIYPFFHSLTNINESPVDK